MLSLSHCPSLPQVLDFFELSHYFQDGGISCFSVLSMPKPVLVYSILQRISIFIMFSLCYLWFGAELLIQESFSVHQCSTKYLMPYRCCVLLTAEAVLGSILLTGTFQFLLLLVLKSSNGISVRQHCLYQNSTFL